MDAAANDAPFQLAEFVDRPVRVAVFRALHLGDLLCATPALRALRTALPRAHITLIGLPWAQTFVERNPELLDALLPFPGCASLPDTGPGDAAALQDFLAQARAQRYTLALQLHGSGPASTMIVGVIGAPHVAAYCPASSAIVPSGQLRWNDGETEVARWLRLLRWLGAPPVEPHREWCLLPQDLQQAQTLLRTLGIAEAPYVCLHPGARLASRRWPVERFARVATRLAAEGLRVLLTGSDSERQLCRALRAQVPQPQRQAVVDACGHSSLGVLGALVSGAQLVVANDTGISHVAAAVRTPSVIVSSGGDAQRWAPEDSERHRVLAQSMPCRPCGWTHCPIGHPCALGVSVASVLAAVQHALAVQPHAA